jgi:hypothetical protein
LVRGLVMGLSPWATMEHNTGDFRGNTAQDCCFKRFHSKLGGNLRR